MTRTLVLGVTLLALSLPNVAWAIVNGQIDDFQFVATQDWFGSIVSYAPNAGPDGAGDTALFSGSNSGRPRMVVLNSTARWQGNYTAAGISRIEMDLRNPNSSGDLTFWLGLAGVPGVGPAGSGETFITNSSATIPADNAWHRVGFDVTASAWDVVAGTDISAALATVSQIRLIQSSTQSFLGATNDRDFLVDNVTAIPEPTAGTLFGVVASGMVCCRRRLRTS